MEKLDYYLIYGTVLFHIKDDDNTYSRDLNGILTVPVGTKSFTSTELARMQHTLEANFLRTSGDAEIMDVVIKGIFSLGASTREDFEAHIKKLQAMKEAESTSKQ